MSQQTQSDNMYNLSNTGCVVINCDFISTIQASGKDRLDLLHRLSTNNTINLSPFETQSTTLTNAIGRIIDLLYIVNLDDITLIASNKTTSESVVQWIKRHTFFQDEVSLQTSEPTLCHTCFVGPTAHTIVSKLNPKASNMSHNQALPISETAWIVKMKPPSGIGYHIIADTKTSQEITITAINQGAVSGNKTLYETLRVEAGLPSAGSEITSDYNPLEAGLRESICFQKGCYTGQEIIARLDSQGKLAKTLTGLRSESQLPVGTILQFNDKNCGTVTSSSLSPELGWLSLAFIKPSVSKPTTKLTTRGMTNNVSAIVTNLPFKHTIIYSNQTSCV